MASKPSPTFNPYDVLRTEEAEPVEEKKTPAPTSQGPVARRTGAKKAQRTPSASPAHASPSPAPSTSQSESEPTPAAPKKAKKPKSKKSKKSSSSPLYFVLVMLVMIAIMVFLALQCPPCRKWLAAQLQALKALNVCLAAPGDLLFLALPVDHPRLPCLQRSAPGLPRSWWLEALSRIDQNLTEGLENALVEEHLVITCSGNISSGEEVTL
ncbi:hypothetical protein PAPYR_10869 [Paratrimastix pyriformis]|uniref:Uncharacterized protein n=1 Tax=Paratrimastix pyriformis TaxID=342808 RepID=A0ABQ8U4Z2_9EUKA|nr:hypothetical protein PAPYR_10869 [Paratrimastix pyriformis]